MKIFTRSFSDSKVMCAALPLPPEENVRPPGRALALSTRSFSVRIGEFALTTSTLGTRATQATGAKLFTGS